MSPLLNIPGLDTTSVEFRRELCAVAHRLELDPSYLAAVMAVETGRTFSPSIRNPYTGAVGLIQFMPKTCLAYLEAIGRGERWALPDASAFVGQMTAVEQLAVVEWYFMNCGAIHRIRRHIPGDYYLAVFMPAHVGKSADHILFTDNEKGYLQNRGLDRDGNGRITAGDCWTTIDGVVAEGVRRGVLGVL